MSINLFVMSMYLLALSIYLSVMSINLFVMSMYLLALSIYLSVMSINLFVMSFSITDANRWYWKDATNHFINFMERS